MLCNLTGIKLHRNREKYIYSNYVVRHVFLNNNDKYASLWYVFPQINQIRMLLHPFCDGVLQTM